MNVLVIGGGGRESELMRQLAASDLFEHVYGLPGTVLAEFKENMTNLDAGMDPVDAVKDKSLDISLVVIGPEVPLVDGLADRLRKAGADVFGPGADGAQAEASKKWTAEFNDGKDGEAPIPQPEWISVTSGETDAAGAIKKIEDKFGSVANVVIKADGLAAGKGVLLCDDPDEAQEEVAGMLSGEKFGGAGKQIVVQERLKGREVSMTILTDGKSHVVLPFSQDHKRIGDGDTGPNTGGMGAYSPVPRSVFTTEQEAAAMKIAEQAVERFKARGIDFRGVIYAGLMLTDSGLKVLEYNVRFGDPETQIILPRLELAGIDVADLLLKTARGELDLSQEDLDRKLVDTAAITICVASEGYPGQYPKGRVIRGARELMDTGQVVLHPAGMKLGGNDEIVTSGGRVGYVTAIGTNIDTAAELAYKHIARPIGTAPNGQGIRFEGMQARRDIAWQARNDQTHGRR